MKKVFKWIGIILLVLILFIIAAPFLFKGKIVSTIKEQANANLNAKLDFGDFDLTLISSFPDFKFTLENLSIANVDSFAGDTLLAAKKIELNINLMSVIKGSQYQINKIVLDHPRITARVLKSGKANWDITKPSTETTPESAEASAPFKMTLKKLQIMNGDIVYDDKSLDFYTAMHGMNHELSGDFTEDDFLLQTLTSIEKFDMVYGGVKYMNAVKTEIKADMDANMPNFKFVFKENEIKLNELVLGIDGWFAMPKEDMDMDLKISAKQTEFKNILSLIPAVYTKDFASVKTSGKLSLDAAFKGTYNDKKMPAFDIALLIKDAMFQYPSLPKAVNDIQVDLKVKNADGVDDHTLIDLKKFHMEMAGNPVDMAMYVSTPVSDANIKGQIIGKINLASVKDIVPLEKGDELNGLIAADLKLNGRMSAIEKEQYDQFEAKGSLIVMDMKYKTTSLPYEVLLKSMYLNFSPQFVELTKLESKVGKSDFAASGKIENFMQYYFKNELLKGVFTLNSNTIDLNEFMGPEEAATTPAAADTAAMSVIPVPANIDFVLNSNIGTLIYDKITIKNVKGGVIIRDSRVSMDHLNMDLLGGHMAMDGYYDTKNEKNPAINFNMDIQNFDIPQTVKYVVTVEKLAPIAKYSTGSYSTTLKVAGMLDSKMDPVMNSLNGQGVLKTKSVVVNNFGPFVKVADALKMDQYKQFGMSDANVSYTLKDGKITVDPFDVKVKNSLANIAGSNSLDQTIDYKIKFEIPRSEMGAAANNMINGLVSQANSKGANINPGDKVKVDVLIGGTVMTPVIKTALGNVASNLKDELKDRAKAELDAKKAELENKARAEVDKAKGEAEAKARAEADRLKSEAEAKAKAEAERIKKEAEEKAKNEAKNKLKGLIKKP